MTKVKISHISEVSQQLSKDLRELINLMSKAWIQHELANSRFVEIQSLYKKFAKQIDTFCASQEIKNAINEFMDASEDNAHELMK